jgi:hypothetical protein
MWDDSLAATPRRTCLRGTGHDQWGQPRVRIYAVTWRCLGRLTLLATLAMLLLPVSASAQEPSYFGTNVIVNGDAEAGPGSADGSLVPVPGWTTTANFTVVQYHDPSSFGFPTTSSQGPPDRGSNFFAGGPNNSQSEATQVIDLTTVAQTIDRGGVAYRLQGYFGSWGNAAASLWATFRDAGGTHLSSEFIGGYPTFNADLIVDSNEYWQDTVPVGTRTVDIRLLMQDNSTTDQYNNAYADSVSLVLTPPPAADLSISLSDAPDPVRPNQTFTHTITVHNAGPDASADTLVDVMYPPGAMLVSETQAPCGSVTNGETHYFYCLGSMPPGSTSSFELVFLARRPVGYTTNATVNDTYDFDYSNNRGSTTTTVRGRIG